MNELYVIQCDDDPYCAPYAEAIFTSLEEAVNFASNIEHNDRLSFRHIEVYTNQGGCFKSSGKYFNEKGQRIDEMGLRQYEVGEKMDIIFPEEDEFDDEINEALRLAGVKN